MFWQKHQLVWEPERLMSCLIWAESGLTFEADYNWFWCVFKSFLSNHHPLQDVMYGRVFFFIFIFYSLWSWAESFSFEPPIVAKTSWFRWKASSEHILQIQMYTKVSWQPATWYIVVSTQQAKAGVYNSKSTWGEFKFIQRLDKVSIWIANKEKFLC